MLLHAAAVERASEHPLAAAVVDAAQTREAVGSAVQRLITPWLGRSSV